MRLLLSNDDGIEARGLQTLEEHLGAHDVWVVAPDGERSAQSHALTLHQPLRVRERGEQRFAVSGTPADCIYVALHGQLPDKPDVVISGINHGSNLGSDIFYSGTVAAAREAVLSGVPAIAVSLNGTEHFDTAAVVAMTVLDRVLAEGLPPGVLLNINVPDVPEVRGISVAPLGRREYANRVDVRTDPFGRAYCWIGGEHVSFGDVDGTDGRQIEQGWATVTPIHTDPTLHRFLEPLRGWFDS